MRDPSLTYFTLVETPKGPRMVARTFIRQPKDHSWTFYTDDWDPEYRHLNESDFKREDFEAFLTNLGAPDILEVTAEDESEDPRPEGWSILDVVDDAFPFASVTTENYDPRHPLVALKVWER